MQHVPKSLGVASNTQSKASDRAELPITLKTRALAFIISGCFGWLMVTKPLKTRLKIILVFKQYICFPLSSQYTYILCIYCSFSFFIYFLIVSRFDGIWRPGETSRFWHLEQHMNASRLLPCLVSGGWLRSYPLRDSCSPAGQLLDSSGNREAPGYVVYFIWKHFSCGSFSPAEFDKHAWSRSSISPAGKKRAWLEVSSNRETWK